MLAEQQIKDLKSGSIIFLLLTKQNSIDALNKAGNKELATQVANEQMQLNQKIMAAFKANFNFCPVYFAFADDVEQLKAGKTEGLLLNNEMKKDPSIKLTNKYFLFAEYGQVYSETAGFVGNNVDTNYVEQGQAFMESCFVLKDLGRYQLKSPFPYYVSCGNINSASKKVKKLNAKISDYYTQVTTGK